ncbi:MAG TPA: RDD family protein [Trichocoleus sp.]
MLGHDLAGHGDRLIAQFIDSFVALVAIILAVILSSISEAIGAIALLLGVLFALFYILCADGLKGGQSYGKQMMGICVIDVTTGRPCTFAKSFLRNIPLAFLGIIDWIFIFSEKRQRLGDMLANTIVIRKKTRARVL